MDLSQLLTVALIVFLAVPAPLIIVMYFITKWKQSRELSAGDEKMLEEMWLVSQKLDERVESLEIILNNELPDWRGKQ